MKQTEKKYDKYEKRFHKRNIKLIKCYDEIYKFKIILIGYDGKKKANYKKLSITKVFKLVDSMKITKKKPNKLSLYSDYNKKNTMKGLGFKNKKSFRNIKINKKKTT